MNHIKRRKAALERSRRKRLWREFEQLLVESLRECMRDAAEKLNKGAT
jgi:hypothetical protein